MRLRIAAVVLMTSGLAYGFDWSTLAGTNNPIANDAALENVCAGAVDDGHGLLVAWTEGAVGARDVFADRIDPEGRRMWISAGDQGINMSASGDDAHDAAICGDGALGAYIVWTNEPAAGQLDIFAVRVDATGIPYPDWAPYVNVTEFIDNDCFHPEVCYVAGQVYIAYKNDVYDYGTSYLLPGLDVACYSPSAVPKWTGEIGPAGVEDNSYVPLPFNVWPDGDGGIYVVWQRGPALPPSDPYTPGFQDTSTFAIRLDAYGYGVWGEDPIELFRILGAMSSRKTAVCPDGVGGLFVAGPYRVDAPTPNLMQEPYGDLMIVNHLDGAGNWQWGVWDWGTYVDVLIVSEWVDVEQSNPAISPVEGGGCVVAWVDNRWPYAGINNPYRGTDGLSIYAQHVDHLGYPQWDEQAEYDELTDSYVLPSLFRHRNYLLEGAPFTGGAGAPTDFGRLHAAPSPEGTPCFVWADDRAVDDEFHIYAEEPRLCDGSPRWPGSNLEVSTRVIPLDAPYVYVPDPRWGGYVVWTDSVELTAPDVYAAHINYYFDYHWFRVSAGLDGGPDVFPPPPVRDFHGVAEADGVRLTWTNPSRYCGGEYLGDSTGVGGQTLTTDRRDIDPAICDLYSVNAALFGTTTTLAQLARQGSQELHVADASGLSADDWVRLDNTVDVEYFQVDTTDTSDAADHIVFLKSRVWTPSGFGGGSTLTPLTAGPTGLASPADYSIDTSTGVVTLTGTVAAGDEVIIAYDTQVNMLDNFWGVMIRRGTSFPPYTPEEGEWVFGGPGMAGAGASECLDTGVVIGGTYYYSAFSYDTVPADTNFASGTQCIENPIQFGLGEVQGLAAQPGNGSVTLTWTNPASFDSIEVWRPDKDTGTLIPSGTNSCTETGLDNGTEYTYTVYVILAATYSNGVEVTAFPMTPVSNLDIQEVDRGNVLSWTNPPPATWFGGVRVQCGDLTWPSGPNDGENIYDGTGEDYSHTLYGGQPLVNGTTYYYSVFVYDTTKTHYSDAVTGTGTPGDTTAPPNATNFTATEGNGVVVLSWDRPADPDGDLAGVVICRLETGSPTDPMADRIATGPPQIAYQGNQGFCYDENVENGTKYYYAIFSYDTSDNYSAGAFAEATPSVFVPPRFTSGPSVAIRLNYSVTLTWQTNVWVTAWAEYGTTDALGQRQPLDGTLDSSGTASPYDGTITFGGLRAGASYQCRIHVTDADGNSASAECPFTTDMPIPTGSADDEDEDGDGMPNGWETAHGLDQTDPGDATSVPLTAVTDPDSDGLSNLSEYRHGTDPHNPDTDGDLKLDGDEVADQTNPLAPDATFPMRGDAGGCGVGVALIAGLALLARRRRRV